MQIKFKNNSFKYNSLYRDHVVVHDTSSICFPLKCKMFDVPNTFFVDYS